MCVTAVTVPSMVVVPPGRVRSSVPCGVRSRAFGGFGRLARLELVVEPVELVEASLLGHVGHRHGLDAGGVDPGEDFRSRPAQALGGKLPWARHPGHTRVVVGDKLDNRPLQTEDVVL